jgi:hypothetical protein
MLLDVLIIAVPTVLATAYIMYNDYRKGKL